MRPVRKREVRSVAKQAPGKVRRPKMLTVTEVAQMLHVHPNSVRRWADRGLLDCYRIGLRGDRRFTAEQVNQFIEPTVQASR